ncbi:hypothetical protein V8C37DRAFT_115393 [Trichoderma ceciliae]
MQIPWLYRETATTRPSCSQNILRGSQPSTYQTPGRDPPSPQTMSSQSILILQPATASSDRRETSCNASKTCIDDSGQSCQATSPSKLNDIISWASHALKSFQRRSLANDQRYNLDKLLRCKKRTRNNTRPVSPPSLVPHHQTPELSTPYPDIDTMPLIYESLNSSSRSSRSSLSWPRPRLPSLPPLPSPLSHAARLIPTQSGHHPTVQSPWYLHVHLSEGHARTFPQQQQSQLNVQDPRYRRPVPNYFAAPYRPYRRPNADTIPAIKVHPPLEDTAGKRL